jgi:hypothetical protein
VKPQRVNQLTTTYTSNQTGAIATLLASALWATAATGTSIITGSMPESSIAVFGILTLLAWIFVPLYVKRVRLSYIIGIILNIIALLGITIQGSSLPTPWWAFASPVYNLSFLASNLIILAGIYFAYKSYQELK